MQQSFDDVPCVCLSFTDKGIITWANKTLCSLSGYEKEEIVQKTLNELVTLGTRIFFQTHFFPLIQLHGHAEEIFVTLLTRKGEEVPVILNVKRQEAHTNFIAGGIVIVKRNQYEQEIIAAKKYAEQAQAENKELQEAKEQLQQHMFELDARLLLLQQQNENLEQLSFSLAHTLQEPLRKLAFFSSMLLSQTAANNELIKKINHLARHTKQLIVQLQHYLHIGLEWPAPQLVDVGSLISELAEVYSNQAHVVSIQGGPLPLIWGNRKELKNLFDALVENAVKFRKAKDAVARITIDAVAIHANAFRALKDSYRYTRYLKVSVADEGIGFSPAHNEKIFVLFNQLDPQAPGYGIGLSICKKNYGIAQRLYHCR